MKKCCRCGEEKDESLFHLDDRNGKPRAACKACIALKNKAYHSAHKEEHKEWCKAYYDANKQKCKDIAKSWEEKNKERVVANKRVYQGNRYKTDLSYRLRVTLRARLNGILRGKQKKGSAVRDLGCSTEELKTHLELQWQEGMSWDNYGNGVGKWSMDHTTPISWFDLEDEGQLKKACHYRNLKPMWFVDNVSKGNKWSEEEYDP